jgi:hypothetical protein
VKIQVSCDVILCLLVESYQFLKALQYFEMASGQKAKVRQDLTSSKTSMITFNHAWNNLALFRAYVIHAAAGGMLLK